MLIKKIKVLCKKNNINIGQLERATGLGFATIRKWDKSSPNMKNIKKVADYFGVPVTYFLD
ncbi:helix-turn-helix domain-containing protein [Veillonella caviae]|uniref:helix-turn-helix domain-containing protein n=1 Tax=Veillonella caviae TaxID=248316 RepID=UPI000F8DABEF